MRSSTAPCCATSCSELDALAEDSASELLSLKRAALESGYSVDHLGRLIREGRLHNAGRPNAPRIRRADLPAKARHAVASRSDPSYDPDADARSLISRLRHGGAHGTTK